MALPQMEPGGNIWTISLASGTEQRFQPSVGTSAEENIVQCQLLTGPTAPTPRPWGHPHTHGTASGPEMLKTYTGSSTSSVFSPHGPKNILFLHFPPLKTRRPQKSHGVPMGVLREKEGGMRGANGCVFASIIFSKGLNCYIRNYIGLQEQRCPFDAL